MQKIDKKVLGSDTLKTSDGMEGPLFKMKEEDIDKYFPIDNDMEIDKKCVEAALVPIMDNMKEHSDTPKKTKFYEAVRDFVQTNREEIVDGMYDIFERYEKGATMLVKVKTGSNPYLPYRVREFTFTPDIEEERGYFAILCIDDRTNEPIVMGGFEYLCQVEPEELKKIRQELGESSD